MVADWYLALLAMFLEKIQIFFILKQQFLGSSISKDCFMCFLMSPLMLHMLSHTIAADAKITDN